MRSMGFWAMDPRLTKDLVPEKKEIQHRITTAGEDITVMSRHRKRRMRKPVRVASTVTGITTNTIGTSVAIPRSSEASASTTQRCGGDDHDREPRAQNQKFLTATEAHVAIVQDRRLLLWILATATATRTARSLAHHPRSPTTTTNMLPPIP